MPKYRLTDPTSGRTVTVSGGKPPTQQDADAIFSHVNSASDTTQPKEPQGQNPLKAISNFLAPNLTKTITQGPQDLMQRDAQRPNTQGDFLGSVKNAAGATTDLAKTTLNPRNALEIGSFAVPVGRTVTSALKFGGVSGGLSSASREGANPMDVLAGVLTGGTFGAGAKTVGKVAGKVVGKAGQVLEKEGKNLPLGGLRITDGNLAKFKDQHKMTVDEFIHKEKLTGNPIELAKEKAELLQDDYDELVSRDDIFLSKTEIADSFNKQIGELRGGNNKFIQEADMLAQKLEESRDFMLKGFGANDKLSAKEIISIRRETDKLTKPNQHMADSLTANLNVQKRRILNDAVYEKVGEDQARASGKRLSAYYDFIDKTDKTGQASAKNKLSTFTKGGATAAAVMNPGLIPALLAGWGVSKAISNPTVLNAGSKAMEGTGKKLQNVKGNEKGMDILMKLLRGSAISSSQ